MSHPITDEEIRNVASTRGLVDGEVIIGLLDRIKELQGRVEALERGIDTTTP